MFKATDLTRTKKHVDLWQLKSPFCRESAVAHQALIRRRANTISAQSIALANQACGQSGKIHRLQEQSLECVLRACCCHALRPCLCSEQNKRPLLGSICKGTCHGINLLSCDLSCVVPTDSGAHSCQRPGIFWACPLHEASSLFKGIVSRMSRPDIPKPSGAIPAVPVAGAALGRMCTLCSFQCKNGPLEEEGGLSRASNKPIWLILFGV